MEQLVTKGLLKVISNSRKTLQTGDQTFAKKVIYKTNEMQQIHNLYYEQCSYLMKHGPMSIKFVKNLLPPLRTNKKIYLPTQIMYQEHSHVEYCLDVEFLNIKSYRQM
jgi:hypothetical protein